MILLPHLLSRYAYFLLAFRAPKDFHLPDHTIDCPKVAMGLALKPAAGTLKSSAAFVEKARQTIWRSDRRCALGLLRCELRFELDYLALKLRHAHARALRYVNRKLHDWMSRWHVASPPEAVPTIAYPQKGGVNARRGEGSG